MVPRASQHNAKNSCPSALIREFGKSPKEQKKGGKN
jgi:hypothetical protein